MFDVSLKIELIKVIYKQTEGVSPSQTLKLFIVRTASCYTTTQDPICIYRFTVVLKKTAILILS